jgi:hypothetical protein
MASPWSFLTRVVSPRRQKTQDSESSEDVKPNELVIAGSTETTISSISRQANERILFLNLNWFAVESAPLAETGKDIQVSEESNITRGRAKL